MMMAHDSGRGRTPLAEETIESVRAALRQYVESPADSEPLRSTLRAMASEAHEKALLPEALLVVLKDIWYSLPVVRGKSEPGEQIRLLQRVVTMCIKEYYAD